MFSKELVAASAEPLILSILSRGENYGYSIIQEVRRLSDGKMNWTDGMLYPVLHRLEANGLIKSRWDVAENQRKRKYYSMKKEGKKVLQQEQERWMIVHSTLIKLWNPKPASA